MRDTGRDRVNEMLRRALGRIETLQERLADVDSGRPEPVAVIGVGCRFPGGVSSPSTYWHLLDKGIDGVIRVPSSRLGGTKTAKDPAGRAYWAGLLDEVDGLDAAFMGISPREAVTVDPQQRLVLEVVWEAFEDAALSPHQLAGTSTGVFVGVGWQEYLHGLAEMDAYAITGNMLALNAGRVAYLLGLNGPAISLDTACSSSLVTVHLACQSLRTGESNVAVAGGVNLLLSDWLTDGLRRMEALSKHDTHSRCRTFDAAADGYVRGEGAGFVVLKRLSDAVRDGDEIRAVIRGSAVNNDGHSLGLTAPNPVAQAALLRATLAAGGLDPSDVSYVEAHGTGTPLGDPIEVEALKGIFGRVRPDDSTLAIGSVKTNLGHLESAAGIAGLIKVVLSLQEERIPRQLHFQSLNPRIDLTGTPLVIAAEERPWPRGQTPRRAGISAFGMAGTNAHVLVEEAPVAPAVALEKRDLHLLPLSARTGAALDQLADRYSRYLDEEPNRSYADICHTAGAGRAHFEHRLALVAGSSGQAAELLRTGGLSRDEVHPTRPSRVAWLFSGQGAQYARMGWQLFDTQPVFRAELRRCDELLGPILDDRRLLDVLYPPAGARDILDLPVATQPALFAVEWALAQLWHSWGLRPDVVIGHSFGELVASCVAGALPIEQGLTLVAARGRLIQSLPVDGPAAGAMASIRAGLAVVEEAVTAVEGVSIAAHDGPQQVVVSGRRDAVARLCAGLSDRGFKTTPVTISHAVHSGLMDPVLDEFETLATGLDYSAPSIPLVSTLTGEVLEVAPDGAHWRRHARETVRFAEGLASLRALDVNTLLDVGPHPTLLELAANSADAEDLDRLPSLRRGHDDWEVLLGSLAELYVTGAEIDWAAVSGPYGRRRTGLPSYPFQRERYWAGPTTQPLLGRREPAVDGEYRWISQIGVGSAPYLSDHRVFGDLVAPAAYLTSSTLAAGSAVLDGSERASLELADVLITRPLVLHDNGDDQVVQLVLTPDARGGFAVDATGAPKGDAGASYLTASIRHCTEPIPPAESLADLRLRCTEPLSPTDFYAAHTELGLDFGPAFRWLDSMWERRSQGEVLARLHRPAGLLPTGDLPHPALLDACVQVALAAGLDRGRPRTYLPFGIDRLRLIGTATEMSWCHARVVEQVEELQVVDVRLFDDAGAVVAELSGLHLKRASREALLGAERRPVRHDQLFDLQWRRADGTGEPATGSWRVIGEDPRALVAALRAGGLDCAAGMADGVAGLVLLAGADGADPAKAREPLRTALALVQNLAASGRTLPQLWIVTRGAQRVRTGEPVHPATAAVWGFARVLRSEFPDLHCRIVDLESPRIDPAGTRNDAAVLARHILAGTTEPEFALRDGDLQVPRWVRARPAVAAPMQLRADASYLVTGGLGELGLAAARMLARNGARHLVLAGRRDPTAAAGAVVDGLRAAGVTVRTVRTDIADRDAVRAMLTADGPALRGVLHCAGVLDDALLTEQNPDRFERVLKPKADGAWHLHELTRESGVELDFFVLYSSVAGVLGSPGQANYAAANAYLDALAEYRAELGLPATSVQWGPWSAGMITRLDSQQRQLWSERGLLELSVDDGVAALEHVLSEQITGMAVVGLDTEALAAAGAAGRVSAVLRDLLPHQAPATPQVVQQDQFPALVAYHAGRALGITGDVPMRRPLRELGLNSLMAVELRNALSAAVGQSLPATVLFDYPTGEDMADYLSRTIAPVAAPPDDPPPAAPAQTAPVPAPTVASAAVRSAVSAQVTPAATTTSPPPRATPAAAPTGRTAAERADDEPIAIIGMACRFPGSVRSPEDLWRVVSDRIDAITEIPPQRWDIDAHYDPDPEAPGKMYTRWGGFVGDVENFDAAFFGISPGEARMLDPQQRLLLEVAWEALERAGVAPQRLLRSATGVFVGLMSYDYAERLARAGEHPDAWHATGNTGSVASGRLSYVLGTNGPSLTVDTACSSSLVTLHLACQSLRAGESDLALAGGATLILTPSLHTYSSRARSLAADGRCKSFDDSADGVAWSEGCGVLALKRLADAQRDGDRVLAVVAGSAVNQDGRSQGLSAPNGPSQEAVIRAALDSAGLVPSDIDYVEAHGTGTALGDPIELQALASVLGVGRDQRDPLLIGAVKSNLGHTQAAAGVANVIKLVLALQHEQLPPSLHFNRGNRHLAWETLPVRVLTEPVPWARSPRPRRAGTSSFGISGTNAHVVITEAPADPPRLRRSRPAHLLALSARSPAALSELIRLHAAHLRAHPDLDPADVCRTLNTGRNHFECRVAILGADTAELAAELEALVESPTTDGCVASGDPTVAWAFVESAGAATQLQEYEPVFAAAINDAGVQTPDSPQAATALELAHTRLWESWGIPPAALHNGPDDRARAVAVRRGELRSALDLLRHWYLSGGDVDWMQVHSTTPGVPVLLPTYPFQRERYWVEVAPSAALGGRPAPWSILGRQVDLPSRESQYATVLQADGPSQPADYRLFARPIVPTAWFAAAALATIPPPGEEWTLRDVLVARPLVISGSVHVHVVADPDPGPGASSAGVRVVSPAGDDWVSHATAVTEAGAEPIPAPAASELVPTIAMAERFYARLVEGGLLLGPTYRLIERLALDADDDSAESLAVLRVPATDETAPLAPAVLDGCIQALTALAPDGVPYLPVSLAQLRVFGPVPTGELHCHARITERGPSSITGSVVLTDGARRVLLAADGVHALPADRATGLSTDATVDADRLTLPATESYRLESPARGTLDNLVLSPAQHRDPGPGEVRIAVEATGLNFRDVLTALDMYPGEIGPLGYECSGRVAAVGAGVIDLAVGDAVFGEATGGFAASVTVDRRLVARMPRSLSFAEAATIPMAYATAWYGLFDLGRLQAGDRVLVHAAAGGVGMAAVHLARHVGATVVATASKAKWDAVRALGVDEVHDSRTTEFASACAPVDVVLNSLAGEFVDASLSLLVKGGRFVEMGKTDIRSDLPETVEYTTFDLLEIAPARRTAILAEIVALLDSGALAPLPMTLFGIRDAKSAFRYMAQARHIGKIVLTAAGRHSLSPAPRPAIAVLFTGQGSQYPDMGRTLFDTQPVFRQSLVHCDNVLGPIADGRRLLEAIYPDGRPDVLEQTAFTQPALFAVEWALWRMWQSWGLRPAAVMGHSIGEYVAACAARIMDVDDALRLVAARGRLMQALPGRDHPHDAGEMAAVTADAAMVERLVAEYPADVSVAAYNGLQVVVSGRRGPVRELMRRLAEDGVGVTPLPVSHAFHSPLMEPALDALEAAANSVAIHPSVVPLISNVTGEVLADDEPTPAYWRRHARSAVRFSQGMATLELMGIDHYLEVGPQATLSTLGATCVPAHRTFLPSLRRGRPDWEIVLDSAARLRAADVDIKLTDRLTVPVTLDRAFLSDHVVQGSPIASAAFIADLALTTARDRLGDERWEVSQLVFIRPLPLDSADVTISLDPAGLTGDAPDAVEVCVDSSTGTHARGVLRVSAGPAPPADVPEEIVARCPQADDSETFYAGLRAIGFDYGHTHASVRQVWSGADEGIGRIRPATSSSVVHPATLDAAFQLVFAAMDAPTRRPGWVPMGIEGMRVYPGGVACWGHVRLLERRATELIVGVRLLDATGVVVVSVDRLEVRNSTELSLPAGTAARTANSSTNRTRLYEIGWQEKTSGADAPQGAGRWLLVGHGPVAEALNERLSVAGVDCIVVGAGAGFVMTDAQHYRVDLADPLAVRAMVAAARSTSPLTGVLQVPVTPLATDLPAAVENQLAGGLHLLQALAELDPVPLWTVTCGAQAVEPGEVTDPVAATLWGFVRTAQLEYPEWGCHLVDVSVAPSSSELDSLLAELLGDASERQIVLRGTRRLVPQVHALPELPLRTAWRPDAQRPVLVTGGLGGLGLPIARWLAGRGVQRLVLVGRRAPGVAAEAQIRQLREAGTAVDVRQLNVADRTGLAALLEELGPLGGVVHLAGLIDDGAVHTQQLARYRRVLEPKVSGTWNLHELTRHAPPDLFVVFSSGAAILGSAGQSGYSAANAVVDAIMQLRRAGGAPALSLAWGPWSGPGMAGSDHVLGALRARGVCATEPDEGLRILGDVLDAGLQGHVAAMSLDLDVMRELPATLRPAALAELIGAPSQTDRPAEAKHSAQSEQQHYNEVAAVVIRVARRVLHLRSDADFRRSFHELGLDSISGLELRSLLAAEVGRPLPPTLAFAYPTVEALARYLADLVPATGNPSPATPPVASPASSAKAAPVRSNKTAASASSDSPLKSEPFPDVGNDRTLEVAIVGVSGRYPGARDLDEYWEVLAEGRDCITNVPTHRGKHAGALVDLDSAHTHSKWGGFVDDVECFDPVFFNISPREAETLDPQERLFLQTAWSALEDAGYPPATLRASGIRPEDAGVFVGVMWANYQLYGADPDRLARGVLPASGYWGIANRVSYFCDFQGPSMAVDTACSSSLTALHLACESLRTGDCRFAIAGGVNLSLHPFKYELLGQLHFISSNGHCRAFGEGGDGYVPGEGVGAVVLRPLADARRDGDNIYGVIRGTAVNHGGRVTGYSVPNPRAQAAVITKALRRSGVDPSTISYIEAHGTGTALGDPIEIAGLTAAFGDHMTKPCPIGSVKSNIGHLESAAGIAALTKVLLQMRHGLIAPSLHSTPPNPHIDFDSTPFTVVTEPTQWRRTVVSEQGEQRELPRRAAISSFGAGGSNAHLIVEEHLQQRAEPPASQGAEIVVISARSAERLREYVERYLTFLRSQRPDLGELAHSTQVAREPMTHRLAVVASDLDSLCDKLESWLADRASDDVHHDARSGDSVPDWDNPDDRAYLRSLYESGNYGRLAAYWVKGSDIDWAHLRSSAGRSRIPLPTYPFARKRYWLPDVPPTAGVAPDGWAPKQPATPRALVRRWRAQPIEPAAEPLTPLRLVVLVDAGTPCPIRQALAVSEPGPMQVVELSGTQLDDFDAGEALATELGSSGGFDGVVDVCDLSGCRPEAGRIGFYRTAIAGRGPSPLLLLHVTAGAPTPLAGLVAALDGEYRGVIARTVQVDEHTQPVRLLDLLAAESARRPSMAEREARYRNDVREVPTLQEAALTPGPPGQGLQVRPDRAYLVTGGTRGLGAAFARALAARGARRIALLGVRPLPPQADWSRLAAEDTDDGRKAALFGDLQAQGVQLLVHTGPLTDRAALSTFVDKVRVELGELGGVLHCAGTVSTESPAFVNKTADGIARVLEPKIDGTLALAEVLEPDRPDFVVLFSSVSAVVPKLAVGLADYAAANAFLDRFAEHQHRQGRPWYRSVNWPSFSEVGLGEATSEAYRSTGMSALTVAEGVALLDLCLGSVNEPVVLPYLSDRALVADDLLGSAAEPRPAGPDGPGPAALRTVTAGATVTSSRAAAYDAVLHVFAAELKLDPAEFSGDVRFEEYGADSVLIASAVQRMEQIVGEPVEPAIFLEHPTLDSLAAALSDRFPGRFATSLPPTPDSAGPVPDHPSPQHGLGSPPGAIPPPAATRDGGTSVAIVGIGCRFPGGEDKDAFWNALTDGRCAIREVPADRWDIERFYDPRPRPGRSTSKWGGFIDDIDMFDPEYFGITETLAQQMDPLQRLMLETAVTATRDAGYSREELSGSRVGVYVGTRTGTYVSRVGAPAKETILGVGQNFIAARIADFFDWHGSAIVVDTACSSSLVSTHLACQALRSGEVDAAVAGGVDVLLDELTYLTLSAAGALSPDGLCRTFDERANGFVPGEGAGAVMLKRLDDALRDGDRIYAVVRGSAVNNDGHTMGITTPNMQAQIDVIEAALTAADVRPADLSYVEAHGTGTLIGDPIELRALATVFRRQTDARGFCAVGSVKTNIGHLLSAAGIASVVKTALAIHHGTLPPSLHCQTPNPRFAFDSSPFGVNRELRPWPAVGGRPRLAGISSFGFGGTNCHLVLGEPSQHPAASRAPLPMPRFQRRRLMLDRPATDAQPDAAPPPPMLEVAEHRESVPARAVPHATGTHPHHVRADPSEADDRPLLRLEPL